MITELVLCLSATGCVSWYRQAELREYPGRVQGLVHTYQSEADRLAPAETAGADAGTNAAAFESVPVARDERLLKPDAVLAGSKPVRITLQDLYAGAIRHSSQIRVFSELPLIRETSVQEAEGLFDPKVFVEGRYTDKDEPAGSTLTTGGSDILVEYDARLSAGVRKKFIPGTEIYVTEELNRIENNSEYLDPNPQAGARLVIGLVQPLLNGAGVRYNTAVIRVAALDTEIARNEYVRQAESHMLEIARAYWALYLVRGAYRVKETAHGEAAKVLAALESRKDFDAVRQQLLRARAVTAERRAALVRAESALRNAVERIKALVNDPGLQAAGAVELIPTDAPVTERMKAGVADAARRALEHRPEIRQAYLQLEAAAVRRRMARNELLPTLNVFAELYLAGLGSNTVERSMDSQSDDREPSYLVGARLEFPLGNNRAEAQNRRRRLELRQLEHQLQTTLDTVLLDVKFSAGEVATAYRDLAAKHESMLAARAELESLNSRRDVMLLGREGNAIGQLNLLLESQERLATAEERFLLGLATYNTALVSLQRAQGTLLAYESIESARVEERYRMDDPGWIESRKLPRNELNRAGPSGQPVQ